MALFTKELESFRVELYSLESNWLIKPHMPRVWRVFDFVETVVKKIESLESRIQALESDGSNEKNKDSL